MMADTRSDIVALFVEFTHLSAKLFASAPFGDTIEMQIMTTTDEYFTTRKTWAKTLRLLEEKGVSHDLLNKLYTNIGDAYGNLFTTSILDMLEDE